MWGRAQGPASGGFVGGSNDVFPSAFHQSNGLSPTGGQAAAIEDMGVDHGGFDVFVAEEFLNGADACPGRRCWVS